MVKNDITLQQQIDQLSCEIKGISSHLSLLKFTVDTLYNASPVSIIDFQSLQDKIHRFYLNYNYIYDEYCGQIDKIWGHMRNIEKSIETIDAFTKCEGCRDNNHLHTCSRQKR